MRGKASSRWTLVLLASLAFPLAGAAAEENCLKRVFDRFCLGGDFEALPREGPAPLVQEREGQRQAAVFLDGLERLYVLAFKGRIYKVVRQIRPSTQLRFEDLNTLLAEKYGRPEDRSEFPPYAESRGRQVAAIRRGEGRAVKVWRSGKGWLVELSWTREMGVALSYVAEALDAERARAMAGGF
jgi:hypothetical protein